MLQSELNEGKLTNTLAAAGLAAGLAHGNVEMKPVQGYDTKYNSETPTLFQVRHNHDFDADQFSYRFNQLPNKIEKTPYDSLDIQATIEKIFATPDSILTKYGRKNAQKIAEFIVKATDKYDIDENMVDIARQNAKLAGVEKLIHFQRRGVEQLSHPKKYGFIIIIKTHRITFGKIQSIYFKSSEC